ncbi:MAG TPA: class I SAM-dependent methyltransferase [Burkholderiales bacterium]|nr:class I SAM-dependent methyltransferase [Burkholderiales bacterium]
MQEQEKDHWETVYSTRPVTQVSWFQEHAGPSLQLIVQAGVSRQASIIDIGGGTSPLVDDLLDAGYGNVTVLDISRTALETAKARLGRRAALVRWIEGNMLEAALPAHAFDVWHDRAVFHFLTQPQDRQSYVRAVLHAVKPGGLVIVATFAEDGPERCSGLPVVRYSAENLHGEFGEPFVLLGHEKEAHRTPAGNVQQFVYCFCRRTAS